MKKYGWWWLGGFFLAGLLMIVLLHQFNRVNTQRHSAVLLGDWMVTVNEQEYAAENLEQFEFPKLQKGDVIILERRLWDTGVEHPVLTVYNDHTDLTVYLNGQEVYRYGTEELAQGKLFGNGYHYIFLPDDYAGQQVRIVLRVARSNPFFRLELPKICNSLYVVSDFLRDNNLALTIDLFLVVFGICVAAVAMMFAVRYRIMLRLVWAALFSVCIGLWSMASYNLTILFTDRLLVKTVLEYGALYLAPVFLIAYFRTHIIEKGSRWMQVGIRVLEAAQWLFIAAVVVLQLSGLRQLPEMLEYSHVLLCLLTVLILSVFLRDALRHQLENPAVFVGVIVMGVFASYDIVRYNLMKYTSLAEKEFFNGYTCIGVLVLVVSLMIDFFAGTTRSVYHSAQDEMLQKLAYTDMLTGLANRRFCEETFDRIDRNRSHYAVLEYDLNCLKEANDQYGHDAGDRLLIRFAGILKRVYGKVGCVCRSGGDEFLVLIEEADDCDLTALQREVEEEADREKDGPVRISAAFGCYSFREDGPTEVRLAYKKADERMYENKAKMKAERKKT